MSRTFSSVYKNNYSSDYVDILKMNCTKTCAINNYPIYDLSIYLTKTNAALTYLTITDAAAEFANYLTITDAASTYLTITDAALTYLTIIDASSTYLRIIDANYLSSVGIALSTATSTYFNGGDIFIQGIRAGAGLYRPLADVSMNTCFGINALGANLSGIKNSAFGNTALATLNTGSDNSAFGNKALNGLTSGIRNVAVGANSLVSITTGARNTAVGQGSGQVLAASASDNTFLGYVAGGNVSSGQNNTFVGSSAEGSAGSSSCSALGAFSSVGGFSNSTAIGGGSSVNAAGATCTANHQIMLGRATETVVCPGTDASGSLIAAGDIYINGIRAGVGNYQSTTNTCFGNDALFTTSTAQNNCAFGRNALKLCSGTGTTTGYGNCAFGYFSLDGLTTGSKNVGVGAYSLGTNATNILTTGSRNTGCGYGAGYNFTGVASDNTYIGNTNDTSPYTTGSANTLIGSQSIFKTGALNTPALINASTTLGAFTSLGGHSFSTAIGGGSGNAGGSGSAGSIPLGIPGATCTADHQIMLGTSAEHVVCPGGIQLQPTITPPLTIPTGSGTLTIPLGLLLSFSSFSLTMTENITSVSISGGVSGNSEYTVFITGAASYTFDTSTIPKNWSTAVSIPGGSFAILSIRYDGARYYLKLDDYT